MKKILTMVSFFGLFVAAAALAETTNEETLMAELQCGKTKQECLTFCHRPENQNRCLEAAQRQGVMSDDEVRIAKVMQNRVGPGGCRGEECRTYCESNDQQRVIECMKFAVNNPDVLATMSPKEQKEMPKVLAALEAGAKMPGGCSGRECRDYCMKPPNRQAAQECFTFAQRAGFIPPNVTEEMAILVMTEGGPGGCRGEDCEEVCSENPEPCIKWMKDHGMNPLDMMPPEAKAMLNQVPAAARSCVEAAIQEGDFGKIQECVMTAMGGGGGFPGGFSGGPGFGPPGGMPGDMEDMMDMMMGGGDDDFDDEGDEDEEEDEEGFHGGFPDGGMPGGMPSGGFPGMPQLPGGCQFLPTGQPDIPCIIKYCTENWQKQDPICQMGPGGPGGGFPASLPSAQPSAAIPLRSFLGNVLETLLGFLF